MVPLSILDLAPITLGSNAGVALRRSLDLAQHAERWGYKRFWVAEHHNVILVGATGVGKSFIACALAHQACRKGYRAGYRRASRLFHELTLARADGTYVRLLGKLARLDVLVIDDWGLAPVQDPERRDLLEILEDRYGARSTIITSQLPPAQWHDYLADATLADAICDRLLHNAHRLVLKGPSRRKEAKLDD